MKQLVDASNLLHARRYERRHLHQRQRHRQCREELEEIKNVRIALQNVSAQGLRPRHSATQLDLHDCHSGFTSLLNRNVAGSKRSTAARGKNLQKHQLAKHHVGEKTLKTCT